jgi:hypothetical protein
MTRKRIALHRESSTFADQLLLERGSRAKPLSGRLDYDARAMPNLGVQRTRQSASFRSVGLMLARR